MVQDQDFKNGLKDFWKGWHTLKRKIFQKPLSIALRIKKVLTMPFAKIPGFGIRRMLARNLGRPSIQKLFPAMATDIEDWSPNAKLNTKRCMGKWFLTILAYNAKIVHTFYT